MHVLGLDFAKSKETRKRATAKNWERERNLGKILHLPRVRLACPHPETAANTAFTAVSRSSGASPAQAPGDGHWSRTWIPAGAHCSLTNQAAPAHRRARRLGPVVSWYQLSVEPAHRTTSTNVSSATSTSCSLQVGRAPCHCALRTLANPAAAERGE